MHLLAHRGEHTHAPENSMQAFQAAADLNAYGIEFDVRLAADNVPVIFHHMHFKSRDREGFIADFASDDLKAIELTSSVTGQTYHIPSFREVVAAFANTLYLEIHVQSYSPETVPALAHVLNDYQEAWPRMELISYEPAILLGFQTACPGIATDLLFRPESWMTPDIALRLIVEKGRLAKARAVHLFPQQITEESIAFIRSYGLEVHCGVVDDIATYQRIESLGVPQLASNNLPLLLSVK